MHTLLGQVQVVNGTADHRPGRVVGGDNLLRVASKGVGPKRNRVVENSDSAPDHTFSLRGRPHETAARGGPHRMRDRLGLYSDTEIDTQIWIWRPMVLDVHGRFVFRNRERCPRREIDSLQQLSLGVQDLHGPGAQLALGFAVAEHGAHLEPVLSPEMQGVRRPVFHPLQPRRAPRLLAEVASEIPHRSEFHALVSMGLNSVAHLGHRNGTLQHAPCNGQPVENRAGGRSNVRIRGHRLGIEEVQPFILQ